MEVFGNRLQFTYLAIFPLLKDTRSKQKLGIWTKCVNILDEGNKTHKVCSFFLQHGTKEEVISNTQGLCYGVIGPNFCPYLLIYQNQFMRYGTLKAP